MLERSVSLGVACMLGRRLQALQSVARGVSKQLRSNRQNFPLRSPSSSAKHFHGGRTMSRKGELIRTLPVGGLRTRAFARGSETVLGELR